MPQIPPPAQAARITSFLRDHPRWSVFWDKRYGLWRAAEDRIASLEGCACRGGLSTKIHLAADRRCRPVTRILTPGQHGDCPQFIPLLNQVRIARRGKGRPRTRLAPRWRTRRTPLRPTALTCAAAVSRRSSRSRTTRRNTAAPAAGRAAGRPPSTPDGTRNATPSNAASASSSSSAPSPPATACSSPDNTIWYGLGMGMRSLCRTRASAWHDTRWPKPPGEDDCRGQIPGLYQDVFGAAAARPGPRTLAADRQPADPPPRELQLCRRDTDRRHHPQTVPPALRRLRQPMAVRDLPRQPRRLRRIGLLHRPARRHLPRRPRHRLRPLPQRPHRLDPTPDELTGETT